MHPFIGYIQHRKEVNGNGPHKYGPQRNTRVNVTPPAQNAPDPPRDTLVNSRASEMQIATFFNIAGINAVMEDHPLNDLTAPINVADTLEGAQHPVRESPVVERGNFGSYGSLHVLSPPQYAGDYLR